MLEIEVKAELKDRRQVEARLRRLGAKAVGERRQVDLYFAHPCRDFGATDEALRLRLDGDRQVMTYKGPKLDSRSKTREEIEQPVEFESMATTLRRLGFKDFLRVEKVRTDYSCGGVVISLDRVDGLGDFVELEVEDEDRERGLERILDIKRRLDIQGNETRSYLELIVEKEDK
jgi:adenylate cyclase, class 2